MLWNIYLLKRASGYGYQGANHQAKLLLSGISGIGGIVHKVLTGWFLAYQEEFFLSFFYEARVFSLTLIAIMSIRTGNEWIRVELCINSFMFIWTKTNKSYIHSHKTRATIHRSGTLDCISKREGAVSTPLISQLHLTSFRELDEFSATQNGHESNFIPALPKWVGRGFT